MDPVNILIAPNHPNRPGIKLEKTLALVFHYTANANKDATAAMNAKYFGRKYVKTGDKYFEADGVTPFAYGSAQVIADENGIVFALPPDEKSWGCGDSRVKHPDGTVTQQLISTNIFNTHPNNYITSIEICNNGDWEKACENAKTWAVGYIKNVLKKKVAQEASFNPQTIKEIPAGNILILRHFDITGKVCPKPFVDNEIAWTSFVNELALDVNT